MLISPLRDKIQYEIFAGTVNMKNSTKLVGFLSAPGWLDPAPEELRILTDGKISVQQTIVGPANFDWHTKSIAEIGPYLKHSAMQLAAAGCTLIASPATPFGYIGHRDINQARLSNHHLQENIDAKVISAITAIFDKLEFWKPRKVALACTYYSDEWRNLWATFVNASGYTVLGSETLVDQGIHSMEQKITYPTSMEICESVKRISEKYPNSDAIVITGAGARTVAIADDLCAICDKPIIAADTALLSAIGKELCIKIPISQNL
jgi:maleate cis-trans isomerase